MADGGKNATGGGRMMVMLWRVLHLGVVVGLSLAALLVFWLGLLVLRGDPLVFLLAAHRG